MRITVISASNKQPAWVQAGFADYAKRLSHGCRLELKEVPLARRTASTPLARQLTTEGERMLAAVPKSAHLVALDERGSAWTTLELSGRIQHWMQQGQPLALLIGGPDGLAPSCLESSREQWSVSALTLPHGLARILVAEAIYRAWSLLHGHPYHRA